MSIVYQQEDTTFQAGDLLGNIAHQGVLASNITGTTVLTPTFPTTSTGTSLGHYHYTESSSNALQFLNVSGSGTGGHKFYTSNSSTAPINTATIDFNGLTIDKSTSGSPPVYSPNVFSLSPDNTTILFPGGTDLTLPPYNMTQTFNPIYMTQTTALYTTGELCYAVKADNESIQIFNNDNIANPIPPNVVPTGFPTASNVGVTVGIPIFTLSPITPSVPQIVNINEELTITTNTDESILSATDLTFNGDSLLTQVDDNTNNIVTNTTNIETLTIKQTTPNLQYISAVITADARPPTAPTTTITQTYAFTPAWYFKNSFSSGINKINWYLGPSIGMTVADVLGVYMNIFNPSMTSNDNCPFIVILTANDSVPPVNFYKSKRTYIFNQTVTPVINTRYLMFSNVSSTCPTPSYYGSVLNNMELSSVAGSNVGAFAPTEVILAFSIHTNSASVLNSVEFAVNKFGIMTPIGTQEVLFIPST
jgi:hypothetical protein